MLEILIKEIKLFKRKITIMTTEDQAIILRDSFIPYTMVKNQNNEWINDLDSAKQCALITVIMIISANPHSNPLNTEVHSTMKDWLEVEQYLELL
jgi:hypothetical protein